MTRKFTETEVRGATTMLWLGITKARYTIGGWLRNNHRPPRNELLTVAMFLQATEERLVEALKNDPGNEHPFDETIDRLQKEVDEFHTTDTKHT